MQTARKRKVAENELLLENVVKHVGQLGRSRPDGAVDVICECVRDGCRAMLAVPFREYARTRSTEPRRFMIVAGHESPTLDAVVERRDRYLLVEEC